MGGTAPLPPFPVAKALRLYDGLFLRSPKNMEKQQHFAWKILFFQDRPQRKDITP